MPIETAEDLAIFFDPEEFGASAVYHPVGADPFAVAVIHDEPTAEVGFGEGRIVVDTHTVQIQRSDVAVPVARDRVQLAAGGLLELIGEPRLDRIGVVWTCEARLLA